MIQVLFLLFLVCGLVPTTRPEVTIEKLAHNLKILTRQVQLLQHYTQEKIRSDGSSGVVQMRVRKSGVDNFGTEGVASHTIIAAHQHSNYKDTVGLGELEAVLNGVQIRTRHNDFRLLMPSRTSSDLHATESIPLPDVPPEVLEQTSLEDQVKEMRKWFLAWQQQNHTVRDYRKYFKAVLCYLEGAWFPVKEEDPVQESFESDRHALDAARWVSLHENVRFMSYTGGKNRLENLAMLPMAILESQNDSTIRLAQFNYRILCHPLKDDLPLSYLHIKEDLATMAFMGIDSVDELKKRRSARFGLNAKKGPEKGGQYVFGLLDELMEQIPGKDNYIGNITSSPDTPETTKHYLRNELLNQAYYHRYFKFGENDASGLSMGHRGFSDISGFAARTLHPGIAGLDFHGKCYFVPCEKNDPDPRCAKHSNKKHCPLPVHEKWSWAVPLEIIYLTPLQNWNPHELVYKTTGTVSGNGRCDESSSAVPYDASSRSVYYRTPISFFEDKSATGPNFADTVKKKACVKAKNGETAETAASGVYIFLPNIPDVGIVRIRYPILPIYGEGQLAWKELNALRKLKPTTIVQKEDNTPKEEPKGMDLRLTTSRSKKIEPHEHYISLSPAGATRLAMGHIVSIETGESSGHSHTVELKQRKTKITYVKCDGDKKCWDQHPTFLDILYTDTSKGTS